MLRDGDEGAGVAGTGAVALRERLHVGMAHRCERAAVDLSDRHDAGTGPGHEDGVRRVQLRRPDVALLRRDAELGGELQHC
jgi:hypothetical protein